MRGPSRVPVEPGAVLHYSDPESYDRRYASRTEDVTYYVRRARRAAGPVLEYGSGTGRITLELAQAGVAVTGVDRSRAMLDRLEQRLRGLPRAVRANVTLRHGDMRTVSFRRRFPLVIAPFNTLQHLYTRGDVEAFLGRVRRHLVPEGRLVFDVYLPQVTELADAGNRYDPLTQVLRHRFAADGHDELSHRQFFPRELEMLLAYNGFCRIRMTSDFTGAALNPETSSVVVSCALASA